MNLRVFTDIDYLDTFGSVYESFIFKEDKVVVPYLNIGIYNHPINPYKNAGDIKYIRKAFVAFSECGLVLKNGNEIIHNSIYPKLGTYSVFHLGGVSVVERVNNTFELFYKKSFLILEDNYDISDDIWVRSVAEVDFDFKDFYENNYEKIFNIIDAR